MKIINVLPLIFIASCAKTQVTVDPEFKPYLEKFTTDVGGDTSDVSVVFEELSGDTVGLCITDGDDKHIKIHPKHWAKVSHEEREELIYHELGHCVLGLGHKNDMLDYCPKSIMYPMTLSRDCYSNNRDYYYLELKGG